MSIVWVVCHNHKKADLTSAERYGELKYINPRYIYPDELDEDGSLPREFSDRLLHAVGEFFVNDDYMLMFGDDLQQLALTSMISAVYGTSFKVLRWDRIEKCYIPAIITSFSL